MKQFDISGITLGVMDNGQHQYGRLDGFLSSGKEKPDILVYLNNCDEIEKPQGSVLMDEGIKWMCDQDDSNDLYAFICSPESDKITFMLKANKNCDSAFVKFIKKDSYSEYEANYIFSNILFRNYLINHQGLIIHASAVEWEKKGILFSAPSETGKSTQANLWETYMGARVLNDDCAAVRIPEAEVIVYGTPWSGSDNKFYNSSAPLSAVVMLEQAAENTICRLTNLQAVSRLMPRCLLPYHDSLLMVKAISNLEKIIMSVPVYLLRCRPDREAVELVYQCIK